MNKFSVNFSRFFVLILLQVFVFNYVQWFGFLNPAVYLLFLILLPLEIPKSSQYIIAFVTGFIVDAFLRTYGIQAFACVLMVFLRPYIILVLNGLKPLESGIIPRPGVKDFAWILIYTFLLVLVQQFSVTILETFQWVEWWRIVWTSALNTLFTTFIILCIEYVFYAGKSK
ncbi:MAG: rod shape-determining protein MreD [Lentimicrobiaceae bacterium]|nr:rod shape-determining protein MreD [Lentimicrobiaceae bacterium]